MSRQVGERLAIMVLCCLAAIRVFIFSAAFPFFNNVDEQSHFDLVMKYASADIPQKLESLSPATTDLLFFYGSPEFHKKPERFVTGRIPSPLWTLPAATQTEIRTRLATLAPVANYESSEPPVYYALAAVWARCGAALGISGARLVYWVRFLNVALIAALVWTGYVAARMTVPDVTFVRVGVPLILAVFPQDAFFSVQNDALAPLSCALAYIALVKWMRGEASSTRQGITVGLTLALACLVKVTNVAILVPAAAVASVPVAREGRFRSLVTVAVTAAAPLAVWGFWCLRNFGDLTGSSQKAKELGWTFKPLAEWLPHPIFTFGGFAHFWSELGARFWRGEFVWGLVPLSVPAMDVFYWLSTTLLLSVTCVSLVARKDPLAVSMRQALGLAMAAFFAGVGFLVVLSLMFDFGNCQYPSRELPYFTAGRLICGALVPFLLLYVHGLYWAAKRMHVERYVGWVLLAITMAMVGTQVFVDRVAFASEYNWFHLR